MHIRRLTALALALALCLGLMTIASAANKTAADFPDYNSKAWYRQSADFLARSFQYLQPHITIFF